MKVYTITKTFLTGNLTGLTVKDSFVADEVWSSYYFGHIGQKYKSLSSNDFYKVISVEETEPTPLQYQ